MVDEPKPTKNSEEEWPQKKELGRQKASEAKVGKNCKMERVSVIRDYK